MNWRKDLFLGISLFIISLIIIFYSYTIPAPLFVKGLARTNPYIRMWAFFLALLSVCLIVSAIFNKKTTSSNKNIVVTFSIIAIIGMLSIYLIIMPLLGYIISTIFFLFVTMLHYRFYQNKVKLNHKNLLIEILKILILSIFVTLITRLIFVKILNVIVPIGKIFIK